MLLLGARQTISAKVYSQKGNSPDCSLRFLNTQKFITVKLNYTIILTWLAWKQPLMLKSF